TLEFCVSLASCGASDSQHWDINFSGTITNGAFNSSSLSGEVFSMGHQTSSGISGKVAGLFSGNGSSEGVNLNAAAFFGGFNLSVLASGPIAASSVDGLFVLEREDRASPAEVQ